MLASVFIQAANRSQEFTMRIRLTLIAAALLVAGTAAQADLLGSLKDQIKNKGNSSENASSGGSGASSLASGLGFAMPAVGSSTMGNAAGVLQYCIKNNYLAGGNATAIKDKLLGKITGQKQQQTGFANGAKGLLTGGDGKSLNLKGLSSKVKEKACDYVLKNAGSLI
jgi:hypothetical protein